MATPREWVRRSFAFARLEAELPVAGHDVAQTILQGIEPCGAAALALEMVEKLRERGELHTARSAKAVVDLRSGVSTAQQHLARQPYLLLVSRRR